MRIINREEFLKLPKGTVYCKYESLGCCDGLSVKETSNDTYDWVCSDLYGDIETTDSDDFMEKYLNYEKGTSFRFSLEESRRDGLFDKDQLFAVYDKADIQQLIDKLQKCIMEVG